MLARAIDIARAATAAAGVEQPESLISEDGAAVLAHLNRAGEELAALRGPWGQGWPELTIEHEITLTGAEEYALPGDLAQVIEGTVWWSGDYDALAGPLTPQEVARIERGQWWIDRTVWWTRNNGVSASISLHPKVSGTLTIAYVSEHWVATSEGELASLARVDADGHVPILPARLLEIGLEWRVRQQLRLDWLPVLGQAELERDRAFGQAVGRTRPSIGPRRLQAGVGIGGLTIVEPAPAPAPAPEPSPHGPIVYVGWSDAAQPALAEVRLWTPRPSLDDRTIPARSSAGHIGFALPADAGVVSAVELGGFPQLGGFDRRGDATVHGVLQQVWTTDNRVDHEVYGGGASLLSITL